MWDAKTVFPEYFADTTILNCPSDPDLPEMPSDPETLIDDQSYLYFGYLLTNDTEVQAFADAYRQCLAEGRDLTQDLKVPMGSGTNGGDIIYRLQEGYERLPMAESEIPVMMDRADHHLPGSRNVLYMDGHVEFIRYPGKWPMTEETVRTLESLAELPNP